jgi:hypothetical protein
VVDDIRYSEPVYHIYKGYTWGPNNDKQPNLVCIVRPDNTLQVLFTRFGQGMRSWFSSASGLGSINGHSGYFTNDSRRGGVIFKSSMSDKMYPVFYKMVIDIATNTVVTPYRLFTRELKQSATRPIIKKYKPFMDVAEAMLRATEPQVLIEYAAETYKAHGGSSIFRWQMVDTTVDDPMNMFDLAQKLQDSNPLDAYIFYSLSMSGSNGFYLLNQIKGYMRQTEDPNSYARLKIDPELVIRTVRSKLFDYLYKNVYAEEVFSRKAVPSNSTAYPTSKWGYVLYCRDQMVHQYLD